MKGYIKLEVVDSGLKHDVQLKDVTFTNKMQLMHTMARSLRMSTEEVEAFSRLECSGELSRLIDSTTRTIDPVCDVTSVSGSALMSTFLGGSYE